MLETYYTLNEISKLLKVPITSLRDLINTNQINACYIGKKYLISEKDLQTFINKSKGVKRSEKLKSNNR